MQHLTQNLVDIQSATHPTLLGWRSLGLHLHVLGTPLATGALVTLATLGFVLCHLVGLLGRLCLLPILAFATLPGRLLLVARRFDAPAELQVICMKTKPCSTSTGLSPPCSRKQVVDIHVSLCARNVKPNQLLLPGPQRADAEEDGSRGDLATGS